MKFAEYIKRKYNVKQRQSLTDIALFIVATLIFHFLYWHTNMNAWLFGPFTGAIFDFFTNIAFQLSHWAMHILFSTNFVTHDRTFWFYTLDALNVKHFFVSMSVIHDCSGIKQMMQVFIFMLFVPGKAWKRLIYWLCCCVIIILLNVIRIVILTGVLVNDASMFRFIHDWVGRPFMYVFIFLMWVVWIECFARRKQNTQSTPQKFVPQEEDLI
ncbi:MAG: exosortase/archaeosortase family protein [Bacteroidales bacterium]|nr:exosortase/archaeosortase family protein [Bacteroidales bacterium]